MTHNLPAIEDMRVGLFVTCAVDLFRPSIGFASVKLLEQAGCNVSAPPQGCCGQVAYNNGLPKEAKETAWQVIDTFSDVDAVIVPSGSCASMLKLHYPRLFTDDPRLDVVEKFSAKAYELTTFLHDVLNFSPQPTTSPLSTQTIAYHHSCAGLRELGIHNQPLNLLKSSLNISITEIPEADTCCGFGGTFCVKFDAISNHMVEDKIKHLRETNPSMLLGGDLSCLMNIAGKLHRQNDYSIEVRHVAEVLADTLNQPSIGVEND